MELIWSPPPECIARVVIAPYSNGQPALDTIDDAVAFADFGNAAAQLSFEQLPFANPQALDHFQDLPELQA